METWQILSADIGGTNSRFGHFEGDSSGGLRLLKSLWLRTGDATSFDHLLRLLSASGFSLRAQDADIVALAAAGPVERGVYSAPPLIPWDIDITSASARHGFRRSLLINDFVAQAFATRTPAAHSAREILAGRIDPSGTVAVIGAGTGLGKAALVSDGAGGYVAVPSEGGHAAFPFVSGEEFGLQEFILRELKEEYVTANSLVSGKGLALIHRFLSGEQLEPDEVSRRFAGSETLAWFARFYGRLCRDFSLEVLSLGGLYIAGGIAATVPEILTHGAFTSEFRSSKTMGRILAQVAVYLLTDQESGLWGAALLGRQMLHRE